MSSISEKLRALRNQAGLESEEPTVNVEVDVNADEEEVTPAAVTEETEAAAEPDEGVDNTQEEAEEFDEGDFEEVRDPEADSAVAESVLETAEVNEQVLQEEVTEQERLDQIEEAEETADEVEELANDLEVAGKDGLSVESFNLLKGQVKRIAKRFGASVEELGLQVIENAEQSLIAEVPDAPEATEPEVLPEFAIATENDEVEVEAEAEDEVEEEVPTEEADDNEIEIVDEDELPTTEEGAAEPTPEVPEQAGPRVELALTKDEVKISVESLRTLARGLRVGASQLEAGNEAWGEGGIGRLFRDEVNILFVALTGKFKKLSESTFPVVIRKFNAAVDSIKSGEKDAGGLFIRAYAHTVGYNGNNNEKAIYDGAKAITSTAKGMIGRSVTAIEKMSAVTKRLLEKGEKSESTYRNELAKVLEDIIPSGHKLPGNQYVTTNYKENGDKAKVALSVKNSVLNDLRIQFANFSDVRPMLNVLEDAKTIASEFASSEAKAKEFKKKANAAFASISATEEFKALDKETKRVIKNGFLSVESLISSFTNVLLNWCVGIALTGKSIYRSKGK